MDIRWYGNTAIRFSTGKVDAFVDPDLAVSQVTDPEVITFAASTREEHAIVSSQKKVFDWPGEYEVSGLSFFALETAGLKSPIAYRFLFKAGVVAVIPALEQYPDDAFVERLGDVHVLVIAVGSKEKGAKYTPKEAYRLVEAVEPGIVIPIGWEDGSGAFSDFLKEFDVPMPEATRKFSFKRSDVNMENLQLVVMEARS